jgi:LPS export ABC transporter protein LptC
MTSKLRNTLIILACTSILLTACKNDIAEIKALTDSRNLPLQTAYNAQYEYSVQGKKRNLLTAVQLDQYGGEDAYIEASGGFTIVFFDSLQHEEARLKAMHAKYYEEENKLIAWENVELFNVKGEKLETEELIFLQKENRIFTEKAVTITTGNGIFHGKGLESNDSFTKYKILNPTGDMLVSAPNP